MHYVTALTADLKKTAGLYVDLKNLQKKDSLKELKLKDLPKLAQNDVLYISTHGVYDQDTVEATDQILNKKEYLDPDAFYNLLTSNGLPNVPMKLKIFACFSAGLMATKPSSTQNLDATFAGKLSALLRQTHNRITVYGYINEVRFGSVVNGHKGAGKPAPESASSLKEARASDRRVQFNPDGTIELRWI